MSKRKRTLEVLLDRHGKTYVDEAGIGFKDTPAPLFRLLCLSLLLSARIKADIAVAASRALADAGWTTVDKMRRSTWSERAGTLNRAGYARYDERTSTMLGETADLVADRWDGDLRNLREEADRDPGPERRLLKRCKGVGDVGADIFLREAQAVWPELRPFVDERSLRSARKLALPTDAGQLAELAGTDDLSRLASALVRVDLEDGYGAVRDAA